MFKYGINWFRIKNHWKLKKKLKCQFNEGREYSGKWIK